MGKKSLDTLKWKKDDVLFLEEETIQTFPPN